MSYLQYMFLSADHFITASFMASFLIYFGYNLAEIIDSFRMNRKKRKV